MSGHEISARNPETLLIRMLFITQLSQEVFNLRVENLKSGVGLNV